MILLQDKHTTRQWQIDGDYIRYRLNERDEWGSAGIIKKITRKGFYYKDLLFQDHYISWSFFIKL